MSVTKRIEEAIAALDKKQLKNALYLTDKKGMKKHHEAVKETVRTCLANKEDPKVCDRAIKEARDKLQATITAPLDDTSLEGIEEFMSEEKTQDAVPTVETVGEATTTSKATEEKTDEELWEECEDCHVAAAAAAAADICEEHPQDICTIINDRLGKEDIEPEDWIRALREAATKSEGEAKAKLDAVMADLREYLERRNSPFLKAWEIARCPNCGGPLDEHSCCSKCDFCVLKEGGE
jgi:hypothetical protein